MTHSALSVEGHDDPALLGGVAVRDATHTVWPPVDEAIRTAVESCLRTGAWGQYEGEFNQKLVDQLKTFHPVEHVLLCSSGTSGVELGLRGLNLRAGDEVILSAADFKGNFLNVLALGGVPVLVDLEERSGQMDLNLVEAAVTSRTRIIIATHLHAGIVPIPELCELAHQRGISVLEDACQMPGAIIAGRRAGTWGDAGVISFGGSKLLSAGRGGAILTFRNDVVARIRRWKFRGNDVSPLSELQAAVLPAQIARLDERREIRRRTVDLLAQHLGPDDPVRLMPPGHPTVESQPDFYKVWFRYRPEYCGSLPRDLFVAAMRAEGISISPGFRGLHLTHARSRFRQPAPLPQADVVDRTGLVLHHPCLLDEPVIIQQIVTALHKVQSHAELLLVRLSHF